MIEEYLSAVIFSLAVGASFGMCLGVIICKTYMKESIDYMFEFKQKICNDIKKKRIESGDEWL